MLTETTTLLVRHFPRLLQRQIRGRAGLKGKRVHEVFAEAVARGLAAMEAEAKKKEGKP